MNLTKQIEEFQRTHIPEIPEETLKVMLSATKKLEQSGVADNTLKKGDKMPPFTLPDAKGNRISSSELPIPATYAADSKGIIVLSFVNADYTKRLEPQETIKALEAIKNRYKDS